MTLPILTTELTTEADIVSTRLRARELAALLGFEPLDQTRLAVAVSEIARNAIVYAGGARVQFVIEGPSSELFVVRIIDRGPGIAHLASVLAGTYRSSTGLGQGLVGAQKLVHRFHVETAPGRTSIELGMRLPPTAPPITTQTLAGITMRLAEQRASAIDEFQRQNDELLRVLEDLQARQDDLDRLNHELTMTNARLVEKVAVAECAAASERAARAVAEAAVATREGVIAVVAHDLRNPLGAISLAASQLKQSVVNSDAVRVLHLAGAIGRTTDRMQGLINHLLDLARLQSGTLTIDCMNHTADELIRDGLDTLIPLASAKGLTLASEVPRDLSVLCDRERVLQILSNLVGNAIKFTPRGGEIKLTAEPSGDQARFEVSDNGSGIGPDELPKIFERLWQGSTNRSAGIGLGLTITKGLVEAHGGRIWVESTPGSGTTFYFTLPLAA